MAHELSETAEAHSTLRDAVWHPAPHLSGMPPACHRVVSFVFHGVQLKPTPRPIPWQQPATGPERNRGHRSKHDDATGQGHTRKGEIQLAAPIVAAKSWHP